MLCARGWRSHSGWLWTPGASARGLFCTRTHLSSFLLKPLLSHLDIAIILTAVSIPCVATSKLLLSHVTRWTHKGLQHESASEAGSLAAAAAAEVEDSDDEAAEAFPGAEAPSGAGAGVDGDVAGGDDVAGDVIVPDLAVPDIDAAIDTWRRCSVVVGMHPDQARSHPREGLLVFL